MHIYCLVISVRNLYEILLDQFFKIQGHLSKQLRNSLISICVASFINIHINNTQIKKILKFFMLINRVYMDHRNNI